MANSYPNPTAVSVARRKALARPLLASCAAQPGTLLGRFCCNFNNCVKSQLQIQLLHLQQLQMHVKFDLWLTAHAEPALNEGGARPWNSDISRSVTIITKTIRATPTSSL